MRDKIKIVIAGLIMGLLSPISIALAEVPGYANLMGSIEPGPEWTDIFDANGKVKNLFGGTGAAFIPDNISAGTATDMSILINNIYVDNGPVQAVNDLGNAYVYRTADNLGNLVLFAGVERIDVLADTYVEFEFNQAPIRLGYGRPWSLQKVKTVGDLLVRFNFKAGVINSVELEKWTSNGYALVKTLTPTVMDGCVVEEGLCAYCSTSPMAGLAPTNTDVWDLNYNHVSIPDPNHFIQFGINVGKLLGTDVDFASLLIKTSDDLIVDNFQPAESDLSGIASNATSN